MSHFLFSEIKELLKSPGGWFLIGNGVLYTQTHPSIALLYLIALVAQRICHHLYGDKVTHPFTRLLFGAQGILALNGVMTLGSAAITFFIGDIALAGSGLTYGIANLTQAVVYRAAPQASTEKTRHVILACCELALAIGLALIAVNAGYSVLISFGLIVPVLIAGTIRTFRPHWLPPSLAYIDMMFLSVMTGHEAFLTGNILNAMSRILVLFGLSRFAVLRARNEGKISIFELEHYFKLLK